MKSFKYNFLFFALIAFFSISCEKEDSQADKDDIIISDYLTENNIDATKHNSGMYFTITKEGFGSHPTQNSTVEVQYKGYFIDSTVFDQTTGSSTAEFPLYQVIEGWQIGIPLLREGGSGTFFIPSGLGYGGTALNGIPANSVLIFEVDLIDVKY